MDNKIIFDKYQGTGNDFIIIDNRNDIFNGNKHIIEDMCNRRTGIGSDGLLLIENSDEHDFRMKYYNSNGNEGSFCGNGGRCICAFAIAQGVIDNNTISFIGSDGIHQAIVKEKTSNGTIISLKMQDIITESIIRHSDGFFLDSGSPHFVKFVEDINKIDVEKEGILLRHDKRFAPNGTNVNFAQIKDDFIELRTYERGVEEETLSCGTGTVASIIAASELINSKKKTIVANTPGGRLQVSFNKDDSKYNDIWLTGPTIKVFSGHIEKAE